VVTRTIQLDPTVPAPPVNVSASPGESGLNVSWAAGTGGDAAATSYTATASPVSPDATHIGCSSGGGGGSCSVSNDTHCRISGLTNGACYDVKVKAFSAVNNPSQDSSPAPGVPQPVLDFWRLYKGDGGVENGGCGQGAAGLLALLGLAPFAPRSRRREP
jgi:Fibronectin type III domain